MRRTSAVLAAVICLLLLTTTAWAAVTVVTAGPFDIAFYNYGDYDNDGYSSDNWTATQINDVVASVTAWSGNIANTPGRQIKLSMFWSGLGGSVLGETYSPQTGNGTTSWTYAERIWRDGVNYAGSGSYDVRMDFNTDVNWRFGSTAPSSSQYDFRSVTTHEIGHTLGFDSTYDSSTDRFSSQGLSQWDKNLIDSAGNRPAKGGVGTPGNFNEVDAPVYFTGANAVAAYGGNVPIYAPTLYSGGSSLTHLDEDSLPNALMSPSVANGQSIRAPTALEWAMMSDLGWSVGVNKTWSKGATTLNWGDVANWTATGVPDAAANVVFSNTGLATGNVISLGGNRTIRSLRIDSPVAFTVGGSGTLTLQSGNLTRVGADVVQTIASPVVLGSAAKWEVFQLNYAAGGLLITGTLTSPFSFTKSGAGTLALSNTATVGDLFLNDGDLTLQTGAALSAKTLTGDGILNLEGGALSLTNSNTLHLWGVRVGRNTTASFTLPPGKTFWTDVFVTVGRDSGGNGTLVNQGTIKADTNLFVGVYAGSNGKFTQEAGPNAGDPAPTTTVVGHTAISDQGGTGLLELKAGSYTTGALYVGWNEYGTDAGGAGTLTQTGGTMQVGGTLQLAGAGTSGTYNLNGGTLSTSQLTRATGTGAGTATFNMGGGTLKAAANLTTDVPVTLKTGGGTIDSNGFAVTLTSPVGGAGGVTKTGAGSLLMPVSNTYTGPTSITGGVLSVGANNQLGDPAAGAGLTLAGGTLQATASFALNNGAAGTNDRPVVLGTGGGTIDVTATNTLTVSGPMSGVGGLTKMGAGSLRLTSAANTYTGNTTVQAGTLQVDSGINLIAAADDTIVGSAETTASLITAHVRQDTLTINAGSKVTINGTSTSVVNFLQIANGTSFTWDAAGGTSMPAETSSNGPASVPEPAAWLLLLLAGVAGWGAWRRCRV